MAANVFKQKSSGGWCGSDTEHEARGLRQDHRGWWVRTDGYSDLRDAKETPVRPVPRVRVG